MYEGEQVAFPDPPDLGVERIGCALCVLDRELLRQLCDSSVMLDGIGDAKSFGHGSAHLVTTQRVFHGLGIVAATTCQA